MPIDVEALIAQVDDIAPATWNEFSIEFSRIIIEECAKVCDEYQKRDPAEDGNGYWAAENCAAAIRSMKP